MTQKFIDTNIFLRYLTRDDVIKCDRIEDCKIGNTIPGKITQQFMSAYKSLI